MTAQHSLRAAVLLGAAYIVFVALHAAPLLLDSPKLWGVDQWAYLPRALAMALFAFGVIILWPPVRRALIATARGIAGPEPIRRLFRIRYLGTALVCAAGAVLFWRFRSATHFLGDGYLWANHLTKEIVFNEPGSSFLYRGIYRLLNASPSFSISPVETSAIVSVVSGVVFLFFSMRIVRLVSRNAAEGSVVLVSLLSMGALLLFFGYVETYPTYAAAVTAYAYFGMRYLEKRTGGVAVAIACAAAFLLHFSAVALLPSAAVLYWIGRGRRLERRRFYALLSVAVPVGLALLWALQRSRAFDGFFYEKFLPLVAGPPRNRIAYPLLSWKSLFDSLNQLALICPMAIFLVAGLGRRRDREVTEPAGIAVFLEVIVIFCILEFIVFNKNIGASRDWDLFAPLAIPLALLVAIKLIGWFPRSAGTIAVYGFALLVFHAAPWIGLNASKAISERRFIDLVDRGYWSDYARGYGYSTLGIYYTYLGDAARGAAFSEKAMAADPGNPRYWYNVATIYYDAKRYEDAAALYRKVIDHDPDHLEARNNLGVVYWDTGRFDMAEREFSEVLARDSTYIQSYEPLAYMHFAAGRLEPCRRLYRKASELGHDMTPFFKELVRMHREPEALDRSVFILEMLLADRSGDPELLFSLAMLDRARGEYGRSLANLGEALRLEPSNRDINIEYGMALYYAGMAERALEHLLDLYARDARDVRIANNIGAVYSMQGRHDRAVVFLEEAAGLQPTNPDILLNLARTHFELGRFEEAWERVIAAEQLQARVPAGFLEKLERAMPRPARWVPMKQD